MNSTDELLEQHWNASLIVLSGVLAFMGAYSAVTLAELYRVSFKYKLKLLTKETVLILASVAVAGGSIWSMHFIGMEALTLKTKTGVVVPIDFDIGLTVISFFSAIICAYVGFCVSVRDNLFTLDGEEIVDVLIKEVRGLQSVKDRNKVLQHMLLTGLVPLVLGGICTACGVCVMHYIGMLAMRTDAVMVWNGGIVTVSCIIAIIAASAGGWILFRVLAIYPTFELLRLVCAIVVMVAVLSMHYTGMAAASYAYRPNGGPNTYRTGRTMHKDDAAYAAIIFNVMFNFIVQAIALFEYRFLYYNMRQYEKQFLGLTRIGRFLHEEFMVKFQNTYNSLKYHPPASVVPAHGSEEREAMALQMMEDFNSLPLRKNIVNAADSYVSGSAPYAGSADVDGAGTADEENQKAIGKGAAAVPKSSTAQDNGSPRPIKTGVSRSNDSNSRSVTVGRSKVQKDAVSISDAIGKGVLGMFGAHR